MSCFTPELKHALQRCSLLQVRTGIFHKDKFSFSPTWAHVLSFFLWVMITIYFVDLSSSLDSILSISQYDIQDNNLPDYSNILYKHRDAFPLYIGFLPFENKKFYKACENWDFNLTLYFIDWVHNHTFTMKC